MTLNKSTHVSNFLSNFIKNLHLTLSIWAKKVIANSIDKIEGLGYNYEGTGRINETPFAPYFSLCYKLIIYLSQ